MGMNDMAMLQLLGGSAMAPPTSGGNKLLPFLASPLGSSVAGGLASGGIMGGLSLMDDSAEEAAEEQRKIEEKKLRHQQLMDNLQLLAQYTQNINRRVPGA